MSADDLPVGATVLAPGAGGPGRGDLLARKIIVPLAVAFLLVMLVYVFFDFGRVSGPSMLPTLHDGDRVLLTKGYKKPQQGDIIFTSVTENGAPVEIVKRVIGVPGDTVEIKDDVAYVNGIKEPDRGQLVDPRFGGTWAPYTVPDGYLFVMGDNRPVSNDSRYIGAVPISGVMGKVLAIYTPITRIRTVH